MIALRRRSHRVLAITSWRAVMLTPLQLGKPGGPVASGAPETAIEHYIGQIRSVALAGEPLKPVVISIMHALGFEHFGFGITTNVRPTRDSRSFMWTTMPREWIAKYDKNAYVEIDPRVRMTMDRNTPFVWDSADFEHCK